MGRFQHRLDLCVAGDVLRARRCERLATLGISPCGGRNEFNCDVCDGSHFSARIYSSVHQDTSGAELLHQYCGALRSDYGTSADLVWFMARDLLDVSPKTLF